MKGKRKKMDWQEIKSRLEQSQLALDRALAADEQRQERVYRLRALQLSRRRQGAQPTSATVPVLVFVLRSEHYAIELAHLVEALPFTACTPLPGAPPELLGLINLRGEVRSVVDLARLIGLPEDQAPAADKDRDRTGYLLLVRSGGLEVALRVDQIDRAQPLALAELAELGEAVGPGSVRFLKGRSSKGGLLLDTEAVFAQPLFRPRST